MKGSGSVKVNLCGRLTVELAGERVESRLRGRQGRQLFTYLVVNRNRTITRDELIDAVWPFELPPHAGPALSTLLSQLRAVLGPHAVQGRSEVQLLLPPDSWVDIEAALEAIGRAEAAVARGEWQAAWSPANVARTIAERGFFPGYDAPWIDIRRRAVEDLLVEALECLAALGVRLGGSELPAAERAARRLVALAPLRESGHVALMEVRTARGNAAEGLRVYEELRRLLDEDLGTAPGAAAQEVHMRLLATSSEPPRQRAAPVRDAAADEKSARSRPATVLPALLAAPPRAPMVGRARDLERLELALERSRDVSRQLVLVAGEPGIGKTRLLTEFGGRAHGWGATVLYGRTDEDGVVPYGPFLEALRQYVAGARPELLRRASELGGVQLRGLLPELPPVETGKSQRPGAVEPALARYRLFDSCATLLVEAAGEAPVVLLLDDLQWADEPTLLLLKHVLRAPEQRSLLVVGAYRDAELHRAPALLDALADLQRDLPVDRVHLRGLARPDVAELVARELAETEVSDSVVGLIHEETEGNPFFALELIRHLATAGIDAAATSLATGERLPEGVREVIMRRLGQLAEPSQRTLQVAAVLGREFDLDVLEAVGDIEGEPLVEAIEEAVEARVVTDVPERPGRYSFAHALTRTALYRNLTGARRVRVHERAADALVELARAGRPVPVAEIAAHSLAALPLGDAERAIEYSARAAAEATELLAYEEAVGHLARALRALEQHRSGETRRRAALLFELGHSQRRSGRMPEARATFLEAVEGARVRGDHELLGRAVLGYGGGWFESGFVDETMVALLEEALGELDEEDSVLRLELLSRLAKALYYSEDPRDEARRAELDERAIAMAERLGGREALLIAMEGRHFALARPENLDERLDTAERIVDLARDVGDLERELLGRYFLISDLIEADRMQEADREIAEYGRLAEEARLQLHRWYHARLRAMRALLEGRSADAAALVQQAFELGRPVEPRTASMHFWVQTWFLNHLQGQLGSLEEAVRGFVPEYPRALAWRLGVAYVLLDQGRREEAAEVFRGFSERGFRDVLQDANWSSTVALAAGLVAVGLGDARDAAALWELIHPFADRNAVSAEAIVCMGPLSLYSGLMALVMAEPDRAVRELDDALERCVRMGTRPFEHTATVALASALGARGGPGDADRAQGLVTRAEAIGDELAGAVESARRLGLEVLPGA